MSSLPVNRLKRAYHASYLKLSKVRTDFPLSLVWYQRTFQLLLLFLCMMKCMHFKYVLWSAYEITELPQESGFHL